MMDGHLIKLPLPCPMPKWEWRLVTDELHATQAIYPELKKAFENAVRDPGWSPKTVKMGGHMLALDYCASSAGPGLVFHSYKTALVMDHPFLKSLPKNAPRAVRHPYYAATRLRYLRMTDAYSYIEDLDRAESSARAYNDRLAA